VGRNPEVEYLDSVVFDEGFPCQLSFEHFFYFGQQAHLANAHFAFLDGCEVIFARS